MHHPPTTITIPVDLTNPGQFFACCGLLELASRLWSDAEGWFQNGQFHVATSRSLDDILNNLRQAAIENTMAPALRERVQVLTAMSKQERASIDGAEEETKELESLRRELPVVVEGDIGLRVDWFTDALSGGGRFKTWAGQQSVLDIARDMQNGMVKAGAESAATLWNSARGPELPFFFDSDAGGQGSPLDIGFSFNPLRGSEITRIEEMSRPALELLAFIGLQRFRPREIARHRFAYVAWRSPLSASVATAAASGFFAVRDEPTYEFRLLYRTKYLKSFLPAIPFQGDINE